MLNVVDFKSLKIPVTDTSGSTIAHLVPITHAGHDLNSVAGQLANWRNSNKECFLTEFVATKLGTLSWISNTFQNPKEQMLFLVELGDRYVGHLGYKDLTDSSVLLDNAIRGEAGGEAKLFVYVGLTLIGWLFDNTTVQKINGAVFCDNVPAIMFNRQLGFEGWKKSYLVCEKKCGVTAWKPVPNIRQNDSYRAVYDICIKRENWSVEK